MTIKVILFQHKLSLVFISKGIEINKVFVVRKITLIITYFEFPIFFFKLFYEVIAYANSLTNSME